MALFGLTGSKSSSKTTENSTDTTTKNAPAWLTDAWTQMFGTAGELGQRSPESYVAGASPLQTQAMDAASTLGYQPSALLGDAAGLAKSAVTTPFSYQPAEMAAAQIGPAAKASSGISDYTNPWEDTVAKGVLGDLNKARLMTQEGNGQGGIGAGQYGGSRQGVLDRTANSDFIDRSGVALGNIRSDGFKTALGAADSDANRATQVSLAQAQLDQQAGAANMGAKNTAWSQNAQAGDDAAGRALQAAGVLGNLGQTQGAETRANIGLMGDLGGVEQGIDQAKAAAPLTLAQLLAQIYGQAPTDAFVGSTTTGSGTRKTSGTQIGASIGGK